MATLREIITRFAFVANTTPLEKVSKAVDGIKTRINLLVGIQAVKGLAALTDRFGTMALDLRNAAEAAGLSTGEFQKLGYAAEQSGIAQESMGAILKGLNKRLQDARMGSEQAALSFAQAGVPPEALGSFRNAEDALFAVGAALNHIEDPIKRAALAQELLGEQGLRLLGALRKQTGGFTELAQSADAAANALSGKQLDAMSDAEQALIGLRQQAGSLASQMAAMLAPSVTKAVKSITAWLSKNREVIKTSFREWAGRAVAAISFFAGEVYQLTLNVEDVIKRFRRWGQESGNFERATRFIAAAFTVLVPVIKGLASFFKSYLFLTVEALIETFENFADKILMVADAFRVYIKATDNLATNYNLETWKDSIKATLTLFNALANAPVLLVADMISSVSNSIERLAKVIMGPEWKNSAFGQFFEGVRGAFAMGGDLLGVNDRGPTAPGEATSARPGPQAQMTAMRDMVTTAPSPMATMAPQSMMPAPQPGVVNAPITVNITGNADTKPVIQAVKDGVAEHFDRVMSQATVAGATVQVY